MDFGEFSKLCIYVDQITASICVNFSITILPRFLFDVTEPKGVCHVTHVPTVHNYVAAVYITLQNTRKRERHCKGFAKTKRRCNLPSQNQQHHLGKRQSTSLKAMRLAIKLRSLFLLKMFLKGTAVKVYQTSTKQWVDGYITKLNQEFF